VTLQEGQQQPSPDVQSRYKKSSLQDVKFFSPVILTGLLYLNGGKSMEIAVATLNEKVFGR
jgi:hypothetical protein